jgi:hypothetical protein
MTWLFLVELLAVSLVAYRGFVLTGRDRLTEPIRERLVDGVREFFECPNCAGWWWAGGITLATTLTGVTATPWWVLWPAASVGVMILADRT